MYWLDNLSLKAKLGLLVSSSFLKEVNDATSEHERA